MSDQNTPEETGPSQDFVFRYSGPSQVQAEKGGRTRLAFVGNALRQDVHVRGRIKEPLRMREALSVIYDIVGSDYRYVPKDRTAYLAYLRKQQATPQQSMWEAQKNYFDWLQRNDPSAFLILDPVISVQPDGLFFEVFSKDESTYAQLSLDWEGVELDGDVRYGTTNIDFSKTFYESIQRMRGYRETWLTIGKEQVGVSTEGQEVLEKKIKVPDNWVRAFLQVQSAATLPHTKFSIAPIDFYNFLRFLRFNADIKRQRRGLRVELLPGEKPRLVLEPWEKVLNSNADIYRGAKSEIIRIWGRRRLMLIRRLLPFIDSIDVHVLGSGMPNFWIFRAGPIKLTLGLSGWTANNWAQIVSFDLLLPRTRERQQELQKVVEHLGTCFKASYEELSQALDIQDSSLLAALQLGCQQGLLMYDLDRNVYRLRQLTEDGLNWDRLEFRNDRERVAHDLLAKGAVSIESETRVPDKGVEIVGKVWVEADQREYLPSMIITPSGQVIKAKCTSRFFRTNRLKYGPSMPLIALRLFYAQEEARRRELARRGELRESTLSESKTYVKRDEKREKVYQLSLDHKKLKIRWGERQKQLRMQQFVFNTTDEARENYYERIDGLKSMGYLDATEGGDA